MRRITALLSWFDEPPDRLYECASSLNQLCTRLVAVDGRYAHYPHHNDASSIEEYAALHEGFGGDLLTYRPRKAWAGQVAKRDYMIRLGQHDSDFVCVVDADETIIECDPLEVDLQLKERTEDVFAVSRYTVPNPEATMPPNSIQDEEAGGTYTFPRIFRALQPMRMGTHHWHYIGTKDGLEVDLWGLHSATPAYPLKGLLFDHRQLFRSDDNRERQKVHVAGFDEERETLGYER